MSMRKYLLLLAAPFALAITSSLAADTPGLGQKISETDLKLWDISIGPDGVGLPDGSGTATQGAAVYAQKCEVCHGKDGHGGRNSVLAPEPGKTARTMANYVPHSTTIFDFVRRAMPWPQPKSLTSDEVYAVTAYILALNKIIGENDMMNKETLPKVHMPNRDGFVSRYPEKH
jgi:mono/diheme cytochrome c family protein